MSVFKYFTKEKIKKWIKTVIGFILNPRLLLCFGIAWMITNGWAYLLTALGAWLGIGWMTAVGGAYLTFLWLPISPEKLATAAIAIFLLRRLFPNDKKTLGVLYALYENAKSGVRSLKNKYKSHSDQRKEP